MHWLYLHFPRLQLDQYELLHPEQTEPVVVISTTDNKVIQCSKAAALCGIRHNMGIAEVTAINANTQILEHSDSNEKSQLEVLASVLYSIASDIVCSPFSGIAINLSPLARYYQGLNNFLALCRQTLWNERVHFSFGSGATIEIAQVLARSKLNKMFSEPEEANNQLLSCSLAATNLGSKEVEQFTRLGISALGQLITLPLEEIGKRFNNEIISYILALKGVKQPPYSLFHPRRFFSQFLELPYAVDSAMKLSRYIAIPLSNNCRYLQKRNLVTDTLQLKLNQREHESLTITINAGTAHHQISEWQMLIDLKLEQISLLSPVTAITLSCDQLVEFNPENLSLLESTYSKHAENLLMGKLLAKLGSESVKTVHAVNDHRPDYALGSAPPNKEITTNQFSGQQPAWLLTNPQTLSENTHIVYGPERIQTGWWDESQVKRDYFIAQTNNGQRLWVFRDEQQQWFVQGYFA